MSTDNELAIDGAAGPKYRVEALSKGLLILRLFDEATLSLRLKDISDRTDIPMPTAFRIVSTLEQDGFIERRSDGSYQPGVAVLALGSAALRGSGLVQQCEVPLRDLAADTGETVNLGTLVGDQVLYLVRLRNTDLVTANIQVGSTLPAVHTSIGKVLLAALDDKTLLTVLTGDSFRSGSGPRAVASIDELSGQLAEVRRQGYAIQDEELALGLRSIAAPIIGERGTAVAGINIAVSSSRHGLRELRTTLRDRLLATAADISRRMAGR
jgi:IclR family pca regulon transcriptional regulator